jgi:hypothetical protein
MFHDRTIIDVFEEILGVPFDPRWTKKISIDVTVGRRLAQAVSTYYESFRLPEKDRSEMRPYLFHAYRTGDQLWNSLVRFEGGEYTFSASRDTDLFRFLKPFLLYSHAICFLDPLPGLLDYFESSSEESDFAMARLPGVAHLLLEYVKIADLIRRRIVVPISGELFGFYERGNFPLSDSEIREVIDLLTSIPRFQKQAEYVDLNHRLGSLIKEQLWLNQRMENRIDLYFPA